MADDETFVKAGMEKYRFYEALPTTGDVVMVEIAALEDNSVVVRLIEYCNMEAMLPHTELTNVRIRSMAQTVKVGRVEAMEVLRVDSKQGYVDVSKKKVKKDDAAKCRDRYESAKLVHRILLRTAALTGVDFVELQKVVAFAAYAKLGHAISLFNQANTNPAALDAYLKNLEGVDAETIAKVKESLVTQIQHTMKLKELTIEAKVNATCFSRVGVDGLREALLKMQAFGEEVEPKMKLLVHLTACPEYLLQVRTGDKATGVKKLLDAIELLKKELAAVGGEVTCKEEPAVIESGKVDKKTTKVYAAADEDDE